MGDWPAVPLQQIPERRENALDYARVVMIRPTLADLPQYPMPPGYWMRLFQPGDERVWISLNAAADRYNTITLDLFLREFGGDIEGLKTRCFFLCTGGGRDIGTVTSWYDPNYRGRRCGRIHWVAIHPNYQGKGLAKPMLTVAMNRLAESHGSAYLTTNTVRLVAIRIYLDFGFVPDIREPADRTHWREVALYLENPVLRDESSWHDGAAK
jgi:GNAT superfamily N-acetyltransferase